MDVYLLRTGVANLASVTVALERLGASVQITEDPLVVESAGAVVLPGVGSFGAGMQSLGPSGLGAALAERIERGGPTLAVCLGMQLLCQASEEAPGVSGLGVLPTEARRLPDAPRLPHFGWNTVAWGDAALNGDGAGPGDPPCGEAYFAHTFCLSDAAALQADGWSTARTSEGSTFVSAVERGAVLACQFHPELSGAFGVQTLGRWLARAEVSPW